MERLTPHNIALSLQVCNRSKGHRCSECPVLGLYGHQQCKKTIDKLASNLILETQSLIQAKQEGRLVVLPCKVGTEIYVLPRYRAYWNDIEKTKITGVTQFLYTDGTISNQIVTSLCLCFDWNRDFGKTIFITQEEAEKALEGLNNG